MKVNSHPIFSRVAEALEAKNAAQIAKTLKVTPGAASQWKKEGNFSLDKLLEVAGLSGVSVHWLLTGEGEKFVSAPPEEMPHSWQKRLASETGVEDTARVQPPSISSAEHTLKRVPLTGKIAAKSQRLFPHQETQVMVPAILVREDTVVFRVEGNELEKEGLRDGDLVLMRDAIEPFDNRIVLALIDGERVIIRRYFKFGTMVHFSAIEGDSPIIRFPAETVEIKYIVSSITRAFE